MYRLYKTKYIMLYQIVIAYTVYTMNSQSILIMQQYVYDNICSSMYI